MKLPAFLALLMCAPLASAGEDSEAAVSAFVANPASVRFLLQAEQYEKLESTLAAIELGTKGRYDREDIWWAAFSFLAQPRPENARRYDDWLALMPGSPYARLARAKFLERQGWRVRGNQRVSRTDPSQFEAMAGYHVQARREYAAIVEKDPGNLLAYEGLIFLCLADGGADCSARWLRQALVRDPGSFNLRAAHMWGLKPRWGGSYEAMDAFARESQEAAPRNPRLRHLLGSADADRASTAGQREGWSEAIELYDQALKHGREAAFLADRAFAYLSDRKPLLALADIREARSLSPAGWFFSDHGLARTMSLEGLLVHGEGDKERGCELAERATQLDVDVPALPGCGGIPQP